jgi:hypothetical protein
MLGSSWVTAQLAASQEGLHEWVSENEDRKNTFFSTLLKILNLQMCLNIYIRRVYKIRENYLRIIYIRQLILSHMIKIILIRIDFYAVNIVTYRPIARKRVDKHVSVEIDSGKLTLYGTHFHGYEWSTNISLDTHTLYMGSFKSEWR